MPFATPIAAAMRCAQVSVRLAPLSAKQFCKGWEATNHYK